jgi:hypothetical protein
MIRFALILIVWLVALAALSASEHQKPNAGLPVVNADYRQCLTVRNGPLHRPDGYDTKPYRRRKDIA